MLLHLLRKVHEVTFVLKMLIKAFLTELREIKAAF